MAAVFGGDEHASVDGVEEEGELSVVVGVPSRRGVIDPGGQQGEEVGRRITLAKWL